MDLTIYKVYNRVVHSYLAVYEVTPTGSEDPNVFVCKDLPTNPPIPPAPPQDSSAEPQEESSSESQESSDAGSSMEETTSSAAEDATSSATSEGSSAEESVVEEQGSSSVGSPSEESEVEGQEESSSTASSDTSETPAPEDSSAESSGEEPLFTIFPARTLVSVASLTDLDVLPLIPSAQGELYRASTVAMLFRSMSHMNSVVAEVLDDVRENAYIQRIPIENFQVVELSDPVYGQDEDRIYYFR